MSKHSGLKFATSANLEWHVLFHNHVNDAMAFRLNHLLESDKLSESDKKYWEEVYSNQFSKELRITVFLLFFGHLEETLFNLCKAKKFDLSRLDRGFGVRRFKPMIKHFLSTPLNEYEPYKLISDAQFVRNALLHAAGRVSLSKDAKQIKAIVKNRNTFYLIKNDRVQVTPQGLLFLQRAISKFCNDLIKGDLADVSTRT